MYLLGLTWGSRSGRCGARGIGAGRGRRFLGRYGGGSGGPKDLQFGLQFVAYVHGNAARLESVPCSIEELNGVLNGDEGMVVKELVGSTVLEELMVWASLEAKLDLHGLHLGSLYLIMLEWFEAMRHKFNCGECVIPTEVVVVYGLGKHNSVRGEPPVKVLVKVMMQEVR
ncbi:hypothetical protein ACFX13_035894 [Malus domestica]